MKSLKCRKCGKMIEGYTTRQVAYMMEQHQYTHRDDNKKKVKKDGEKNVKKSN